MFINNNSLSKVSLSAKENKGNMGEKSESPQDEVIIGSGGSNNIFGKALKKMASFCKGKASQEADLPNLLSSSGAQESDLPNLLSSSGAQESDLPNLLSSSGPME